MKRLHRTLLTALALAGLGGGAALWTLSEKVKTPETRFREAEDTKRLFRFGRADARRVRLTSPTATVTLGWSDDAGWALVEPVRWPADPTAVEALLDRMTGVKLDRELEAPVTAETLARVGLDRPRIRVEVDLREGPPATLLVGPRNALEDAYPITDGARRRVGLSEPSFHWALERPLEDFRERRLFPFAEGEVEAVSVRRGDGEPLFTLTRTSSAWQVEGPGHPASPADPSTVQLLVVRLTKHLKVRAFLNDALDPASRDDRERHGLAPGILVVEVKPSRGPARAVRFGAFVETSETAGTAIAHPEGSSAVVEVDGVLRDDLVRPAASFLDRTVLRFDHRAVARVLLHHGSEFPTILERQGATWKVVSPRPAAARAWKVDALVRALSSLRAVRTHAGAPTAAQLAEWSLAPPARRAVFRDAAGQVLGDLAIGARLTETELLVRAAGATAVEVVQAKRLLVLPARPEDLIDPDGP